MTVLQPMLLLTEDSHKTPNLLYYTYYTNLVSNYGTFINNILVLFVLSFDTSSIHILKTYK